MNDSSPQHVTAPVHLVDTDEAVSAAVDAIQRLDEVALDTEFHAERRYHAELMLMQVAAPDGEAWLGDPRACDLGPIIRAVSSRRVVVHAGQEDLAILKREADTAPQDLLDVQIAAGMMGLGYPTRLASLTAAVLGHRIDKQATLSDWARRPLSERQLGYAIADVRILGPLAQRLRTELKTRGRLGWATAASAEMAASATRPRGVRHTWTDWDIAHQLEPETRATLQAIFEWRDARGRDKDQPPHYMLSDGLALDVARRRPQTVDALSANRRMPSGLVRRFGAEIVKVVQQAALIDLSPVQVPSPVLRRRADGLRLWARIQAEATGIAPALAMPRPLALELAQHGISALTGWRQDALGPALAAVLEGETSLVLGPGDPAVR